MSQETGSVTEVLTTAVHRELTPDGRRRYTLEYHGTDGLVIEALGGIATAIGREFLIPDDVTSTAPGSWTFPLRGTLGQPMEIDDTNRLGLGRGYDWGDWSFALLEADFLLYLRTILALTFPDHDVAVIRTPPDEEPEPPKYHRFDLLYYPHRGYSGAFTIRPYPGEGVWTDIAEQAAKEGVHVWRTSLDEVPWTTAGFLCVSLRHRLTFDHVIKLANLVTVTLLQGSAHQVTQVLTRVDEAGQKVGTDGQAEPAPAAPSPPTPPRRWWWQRTPRRR